MTELPKEWIRLASEDLKTAKILSKEEVWSNACFHAQQAAEKGLKALIENKKEVPKVHDLLKLLQEAKKCGFKLDEFEAHFEYLNQFYTSTRYPFLTGVLPHGIPGKKEASQALTGLDEFLDFVKGKGA